MTPTPNPRYIIYQMLCGVVNILRIETFEDGIPLYKMYRQVETTKHAARLIKTLDKDEGRGE